MAKASAADIERLQTKLFGRWVEQRLAPRNIKLSGGIQDAFKTGILLISLLEELSEVKFTGKINRNPKMRPQMVDNINVALKFCFDQCGVEMKLKPSAEDIIDGRLTPLLGFVWAIMLKYIKIEDEEGDGESLNARDSLLMWVKNKTNGYSSYGVDVKDFTKSFCDGKALCALIHKHRPKLIDMDALTSDSLHNIQMAFDAAEKFFQLEKYLEPTDIPKLDEKCMVIYISDYYYGIAEQRKIDLAARRISKLITLTIENDRMRAEYNETSTALSSQIKEKSVLLEDRTIDNTMAGAKARLEAFYDYKKNDKNVIIGRQLDLEGLYNNLAMRLAHHKRPEFLPEYSLSKIAEDIKHLEVCEAERQIALHAELNRQMKLVSVNENHDAKANKIKEWQAEKVAFLNEKPQSSTVSAALFQIRLLDSYEKEAQSISASLIAGHKKLGDYLEEEKYENISNVRDCEAAIASTFSEQSQLSSAKRPLLQSDLAREEEKERLRLEYAEKASEFVRFTREISDACATDHFGFTLAEVEAYQQNITTHVDSSTSKSNEFMASCSQFSADFDAQGGPAGESLFAYSQQDIAGLEAAVSAMNSAFTDRQTKYDEELATQRYNDDLCKKFAGLADPLIQWVNEKKTVVTSSKDALADQFAFVEGLIGSLESDGASLNEMKAISEEMEQRGITNNIHTGATMRDIEVLWEQYRIFLDKKKQMLEVEIENAKLRGITPEQFAEIEEQFNLFDRNKNGVIDKRELRACLYSLGEEKKPQEIEQIMNKYGINGGMPYDNFKEFMIDVLGDSDTQDEILVGWKLVNRGEEEAIVEKMELVMDDHDIDYVKKTAPPKGANYDYHSWTADVFSR